MKNAYEIYTASQTTNYWIKRELIKENIITAYSKMGITEGCYDLSFLPEECIEQLLQTISEDFESKGIIRTTDL